MAYNDDSSPRSRMGLCRPIELPILLHDASISSIGTKSLIDGMGKGIFLLWTAPVSSPARMTLNDAVEMASTYIASDSKEALMITYEEKDLDAEKGVFGSVLVVLTRLGDKVNFSIDSKLEQNLVEEVSIRKQHGDSKSILARATSLIPRNILRQKYIPLGESASQKSRVSKIFITGGLIVLGVLVMSFIAWSRHSVHHSWMRYDTHGSIGPKYQLQFNRHNVTEWANSPANLDHEWEFRIDDQAMIPAALYTPEEERYQEWFQRRYPEKNEIKEKKLYLDKTFLSDPYSLQVPSDDTFHTAHCVLAMRRYWWARESGHHVCARDIDYRHMKHCLDSLDELAFPGGLRGIREWDEEHDDTVLIWKTKVCFDE